MSDLYLASTGLACSAHISSKISRNLTNKKYHLNSTLFRSDSAGSGTPDGVLSRCESDGAVEEWDPGVAGEEPAWGGAGGADGCGRRG